jgi:hemerythrin-like metal-binding protein
MFCRECPALSLPVRLRWRLTPPPFDLRAFKTTYLQFQSQLEQAIPGRITLNIKDIPSDSECPLGLWILSGRGVELFGDSRLYTDLTKAHKEIHSHAEKTVAIINEKGRDCRAEAEKSLKKFLVVRDIIFDRINRLYMGETENTVPKLFMEWSPELETGIAFVDRDHKVLVDMVNDLHRAMKQEKGVKVLQKILDRLAIYTVEHFGREETIFEKYGYGDMESHKQEHHKLVGKVVEFIDQFKDGEFTVAMDLLLVTKQWLILHILHTDMKFIPFMKKHRVR